MKPQPVILHRPNIATEDDEIEIMHKYFPVMESRMDVPKYSLVIGRMSTLPFYQELIGDLSAKGATLINSYYQHRYIADLVNYVQDLTNITPPTYTISDVPYLEDDDSYNGFILKGETTSLKFLWDSAMHAESKADITKVYLRLTEDSQIGNQTIYIRRCAKLKTFLKGPHGLPITNEYRSFVYRDQILATGFYWSSYSEDIPESDRVKPPTEFLESVAKRLASKTNFYTIDSALTTDNKWIVVECNDGQQSGLSDCDPEELYHNLANILV